jgi:hypothetical protein
MTIILVVKNKILVVMDTCDYKPYSRLGQVAKDNQSQKIPHGMYNHIKNHISLAIIGIFHPLINCRTMQLHIGIHKILNNIFLIF